MCLVVMSRRAVFSHDDAPFSFLFLSDTPVLSDLSFMRAMTVNCNDNEAAQKYSLFLDGS